MKTKGVCKMSEKYNVICLKWGNWYPVDDVNKLYHMIKRHTSFDIDFYCFTDDPKGLDPEIIAGPMTHLNVRPEQNKYAYRKEAGLCDDNLGGLNGQRVFYFDLDSLIVGNLDEFFRYPQGDKFYIINDWNSKGQHVGQASCYSWVVGTLGYIKKYFEDHPEEVVDQFYTASQEYLSSKVIEKYGHLNFWPEKWFCSFRFHCLPPMPFRWWMMPKIPKWPGLKMVAFHGMPGMEDARLGIWCSNPDDSKYPRGLKRLYKHTEPVKWIDEYWK